MIPLFFLKAFKLLLIPLLELAFLRVYLFPAMNFHLGLPGFTDYELFFPALLGLLTFLWVLEREQKIVWRTSFTKFFIHLFFLGSLLGVSLSLTSPHSPTHFLVWGWWVLLVAFTVSGFLLLIDIKNLLGNSALWSLFPSLLMVFSLVIYFKWGGDVFENLLPYWAGALRATLRLVQLDTVEVHAFSRTVQLHQSNWTAHIGRGCAGFDSLIFFLGGFCIFAPLFWKRLSQSTWIILLILGVLFFSFLNFLRIALLFGLGLFLMDFMPQKEAISWAMSFFHLHLGYLLYGLGLLSYFQLILGIASKEQDAKSLMSPSSQTPEQNWLQPPLKT